LQYGTVQDLATGAGSAILTPFGVAGFDPSGKVPTVYSYSLGIQRDLGNGMMLDVAYVGNQQRHLSQMINENYIPYGYCFTLAAQDPYNGTYLSQGGIKPETSWLPSAWTSQGYQFSGDNALQYVDMVPYKGYSVINHYTWDGIANYNSLQAQLTRRFGHNFKFGAAYTWSKTMDTTDSDGSWVNVINQKVYNYQLAGFDHSQNLAINYIYQLPKLSNYLGHSKLMGLLTDNFEVSGISQFITGAPAAVGLDLSWYQRMITGSWTEGTRAYLKPGAHPVKGHGRYAAVDPTAFVMPNIGVPTPWPKQYLRNGGTNSTDLAVMKRIPISSDQKRYLELRMEAFNAFNHPQFWGRNLYAQPSYNNTGSNNGGNIWGLIFGGQPYENWVPVNPNNIRGEGTKDHLGAYFGDYNSGGNPRVVQLATKLYF